MQIHVSGDFQRLKARKLGDCLYFKHSGLGANWRQEMSGMIVDWLTGFVGARSGAAASLPARQDEQADSGIEVDAEDTTE
jgi:hypothetical protein